MIFSIIWNTSKFSALYLSCGTIIFIVECCQFGPSWMFGLKMELMACTRLVGSTTEQSCIFPDLICQYHWYETIPSYLHYNSAVPQPFLLLIAANFAQSGCLGWKWILLPVATWLTVQRSRALFLLNLFDIINYMKHFWTVSITPPSYHIRFWLLIAANLALAGYLGWKWSLWPVPTWMAVQQSKAVFFLTLHDSINAVLAGGTTEQSFLFPGLSWYYQ